MGKFIQKKEKYLNFDRLDYGLDKSQTKQGPKQNPFYAL